MHNFPFPQTNPANQPGLSPDLAGSPGFFGNTPKSQNPLMFVNVIVNIAIPFPKDTEIDDNKRQSLSHAIKSEMVLVGVSVIGLRLDCNCIQLQAKIPAHITLERILRSILTRVSYTLHVINGKPVFFTGSALVSTQDITPDEISELVS